VAPSRPKTVALGRVHAGKTVTIDVTETALIVACDDGPRTIRRTNQLPIRNLKAFRARNPASTVTVTHPPVEAEVPSQ
jgi:hypothetical protein